MQSRIRSAARQRAGAAAAILRHWMTVAAAALAASGARWREGAEGAQEAESSRGERAGDAGRRSKEASAHKLARQARIQQSRNTAGLTLISPVASSFVLCVSLCLCCQLVAVCMAVAAALRPRLGAAAILEQPLRPPRAVRVRARQHGGEDFRRGLWAVRRVRCGISRVALCARGCATLRALLLLPSLEARRPQRTSQRSTTVTGRDDRSAAEDTAAQ